MKEDELLDLWKRGGDMLENGRLDGARVEKLLRPRIRRLTVQMAGLLFTYMLAQAASIPLLAHNLFAYRGNGAMQAVSALLLLASVLFLAFGGSLFRSYRRLSRQDGGVYGLMRAKTLFFTRRFAWWNLVAAASLWIVAFAVNSVIDNAGGVYRINRPFVFAGTSVAMMAFIYFTNRSVTGMALRETYACLAELESAWEGSEQRLEQMRRRQRRFMLVAVAVLAVLLLLGLLVFLGRA